MTGEKWTHSCGYIELWWPLRDILCNHVAAADCGQNHSDTGSHHDNIQCSKHVDQGTHEQGYAELSKVCTCSKERNCLSLCVALISPRLAEQNPRLLYNTRETGCKMLHETKKIASRVQQPSIYIIWATVQKWCTQIQHKKCGLLPSLLIRKGGLLNIAHHHTREEFGHAWLTFAN